MSGSDPVQFEAVIVPHRSLSPAGLRWVVGGLCALSAAVSTGLWLLGAWPVLGFTGIEILLAVWLIRRNAQGARATEMLLLSGAGLRILRTDRRGRRSERVLASYWLRAELEERPGRAPALFVQDRGARVEVGAELGEQEKRELAAALRQALERRRNPIFDNAQLRG
ncbi:MAG TPA: DUF2244 domain-containing protein [Acetobacteraceae bacterium]|nr:DUF2244 domain-containing protein [Acetobacteraceae bacterium]